MAEKLIDIAAELRHETDKAYRIFDGTKTKWVPKSQCEISYEHYDGDKGSRDVIVTMPEWLALEKGFI